MERKVKNQVTGYPTQDGAGVNLVRVLGNSTIKDYDPILMLDSFDSTNPQDYTAGFPMHPHRGIETISYVSQGKMKHRDSLGNEDTISDGEVQWMTAGSGIMHEEMLPAAQRMLGVQLWLNLPQKDKMTVPSYHSIKNSQIQEIELENAVIRLLAGEYKGKSGFIGKHLPLDYYEIYLKPGAEIRLDTQRDRTVIIFTLLGEICIGGTKIKEKTAARLTQGEYTFIKSEDKSATILFISSAALEEPVAWGGPIVMNTGDELKKAFADLERGSFIQDKMSYDK